MQAVYTGSKNQWLVLGHSSRHPVKAALECMASMFTSLAWGLPDNGHERTNSDLGR